MVSIIVPVLNEALNIQSFLVHLAGHISGKHTVEVILVDGGSSDNTVKIIEETSSFLSTKSKKDSLKIQLIHSEKGRAKQMNKGASLASSEALYFLHADTFPPKNFDHYILEAVKNGKPAGCFKMKFNSNHWWLKLAGWLTQFNWRASRGGDQSLFITKKLFNEIGGYDESFFIYEDILLINELYNRKSFVVLPYWITTSARLYEECGVWNLQYHFFAIYLKRWLGADAAELYKYYLKHIKPSKEKALQEIEKHRILAKESV